MAETRNVDADMLWDRLQSAWDGQNELLDKNLSETEPDFTFTEPALPVVTSRVRQIILYSFLFLAFCVGAVHWFRLKPSMSYNTNVLVINLFVAVTLLLLGILCASNIVRLYRLDPLNVNILGLSHGFLPKIQFTKAFAILSALIVSLIVASCTTTDNDNIYITQNHAERTYALECVDTIMKNL